MTPNTKGWGNEPNSYIYKSEHDEDPDYLLGDRQTGYLQELVEKDDVSKNDQKIIRTRLQKMNLLPVSFKF